jgi:hypothetical protein
MQVFALVDILLRMKWYLNRLALVLLSREAKGVITENGEGDDAEEPACARAAASVLVVMNLYTLSDDRELVSGQFGVHGELLMGGDTSEACGGISRYR